jgi:hypothetical protein
MKGRCKTRALGVSLALLASPAFAQVGPVSSQTLFFDQASNAHQGNYVEVEAGLIYNDNVELQRGGPSDTLAMLGLVADDSYVGPRLDYRLDSDLALIKYLHSEFQTQPFGYADGSGDIKIVPGLFAWTARDTYNQAVLNPDAPITPDNLEAINYLTTGPRLTLRPTLRTTVTVDAFYSIVDSNSKSPLYVNINDHSYGGDLIISRAFTNTTSAYVSATSEKVEFSDTTINTDFRDDMLIAGLKFADARTEANLSAGYTKLHETTLQSVEGILGTLERPQNQAPSGVNWRVDLARLITPTQRVSVHALQEITDAANLFRLSIDQPVPTTAPNRVVNGQPFTDREYGVTWRLQASRTSLEIDALDISQRYEATPVDNRDSKIVSALFSRQLSAVLNWDIGANFEHDDYDFGAALNTINFLTSLRWKVGQRVGLRLVYSRYELSPHAYGDNQVGLIVSYSLPVPGAGAPPGGATTSPLGPFGLQPNSPMSSQMPYPQ